MKRAWLISVLYLLAPTLASAQGLGLPRSPEKLVPRVRAFWAAVVADQRLRALEFVLPEKRDLFLSGKPTPILKAEVVGLDLTNDPGRAAVRVKLNVFDVATGGLSWTITDSWIWERNNWFLEVVSPPDLFRHGGPAETAAITRIQQEIDQSFELLSNPVDLGTLNEGEHPRIEIPIKYTGNVPVSVDMQLENPLVSLDASSSVDITSRTKSLVLLIGTENWEGPFNLPLPLKIRHEGATVERTLVVKGSVFVPIAFRQSPANGPIREGNEFSVFIRNNTSQKAGVTYIAVDGKLDILKQPRELLANQEAEVVLRLKPGESPDRLYLTLDTPLHGRDAYVYRFRNVSR